MNAPLTFIRTFFILLSSLLLTLYATTMTPDSFTPMNTALGLGSGLFLGLGLVGLDRFCQKFDLRSFNITALGLFFGYIMGQIILMVVHSAFQLASYELTSQTSTLMTICVYLVTIYIGMAMTARSSEELNVSIPFVKFKPTSDKKRDVLMDVSILSDPRMIDLAACGLLDYHLVVPRFILKELYSHAEGTDENLKGKAKRCLEVLKRLEDLPNLNMRYTETDFPEAKDMMSKLVRLARLNDSTILTSDINRIQQSSIEGVQIINIHSLANALKPITQTGETLMIKIQRYGKEPRQGVGYLEDGTMVVVNGGAEYIGETIEAHVLSVKHTSSGRMIFCNAPDEEGFDGFRRGGHAEIDSPRNYVSV